MNVAIIGYGRMGKEIEKVLEKRGHLIVSKIDKNNFDKIQNLNSQNIDVAIEFTNPNSAYKNILNCFEANIPVVSGTTGWTDKLSELKEKSFKEKKGFLYASNFSIGVNILFALNKKLAQVMNNYPEYSASIEETHHTKKLDSPSGTAITLAEGVIKNLDMLDSWAETNTPAKKTIGVKAYREGEVPGIHKVKYDSTFDTLQISHSAKSREGFALGAVLAAEFMQNKRNYFEMKDVLKLNSL